MMNVNSPLIPHVVRLLKVLADENRIRIMILLREESLSVNELAERLNLPQPAVSRHLIALREVQLITAKRDGQRVYHEVADEGVFSICETLCSNVTARIDALHRDVVAPQQKVSRSKGVKK